MRDEHLAKEAARLKADEIFNHALDAIRLEAFERLAACPPDDMAQITRWQQRVAVVEEIRSTLDGYILNAEASDSSESYA